MSEVQNQNTPTGILIDQLKIEVEAAHSKGMKLWEERLHLWIRPKPNWMPSAIWNWMLSVVLTQNVSMRSPLAEKNLDQALLLEKKKGEMRHGVSLI